MGAETAGKKLGIGLRLAAKAVKERAADATAAPNAPPPSAGAQPNYRTASAYAAKSATQAVAKAPQFAKGVAQGTRRFGEAFLGPLTHTGGVLWLEITGLFFALFAAFFAQNVYKFRHNYASGPEHVHFLVYTALAIIFAWFTITSFYKARQKEKRNRARRAARQV
jgi:hypothetical protein